VRALHERILRQEPPDVKQAAKTTAADTVVSVDQRTAVSEQSALARFRETGGRSYPLRGAAMRIGRFPDNEITLNDAEVSRLHAVIIDTGTSFVISDVRSANGVEVAHQTARRRNGRRSTIGRFRPRRSAGTTSTVVRPR
jgi:pSer/pThr/pTyr-binding forkhead associated (FHA) protein